MAIFKMGRTFIRMARGDINNYADVINQSAAISVNETAEEGVFFGQPEDPPPGDVIITDAYFAERVVNTIETDETGEPFSYAFNFNNTITDSNKETIAAVIVKNSEEELAERNEFLRLSDVVSTLENKTYEAKEDIELPTKKLKESVSFNKISLASLEKEVYVLVGYFGTVNSIRVSLKEKEPILTDGGALPVLQDDSEVTTITLEKPEEDGLQAALYYAKIKLRPQDDDKLKEWREKLQEKEIVAYNDTINQRSVSPDAFGPMSPIGMEPIYGETVKSLLSIEVEAQAEGEVIYCGTERSHVFLNEEGGYFQVVGSGCSRCGRLTMEELNEVFPNGSDENKIALMNAFNEGNDKFGIDTCQQKAHFFAQVREEVGLGISISNGENLNYAVEALPDVPFRAFQVPGTRQPNDLAFQYGRINARNIDYLRTTYNRPNLVHQAANQEMIANIAYANRNGNRDIASGDGWRYRGKGILQLTGRDKYERVNNRINSDFPEFNIEIDGDNINNLREGTIASMAYWKEFGCQEEASKGHTQSNVDAIVDIININTPSRNERWEHFQRMLEIFKVDECNGGQSVKEGYDIDAAVRYIEENAEPSSVGLCAKYVRLAIEAGGLTSTAYPRNALNYFDILSDLGFTELQTTNYVKGDIVVFDAVPGHQYGHIAMWTGTQWISDFKQNSIIVNSAYNNGRSSIFRWQ